MKSYTKHVVTLEEAGRLAAQANCGIVRGVIPLEAGEFNTAFRIETERGKFVLKIAPLEKTRLLTYEYGIMETELEAYRLIAQHTQVKTPVIVYERKNDESVGSSWYLMTFLEGRPLSRTRLSPEEREVVQFELGRAVRQLHTIHGQQFGYPQRGLYPDWEQAYGAMIRDILSDADSLGLRVPDRARIEALVSRASLVLRQVQTPTFVHFDIWAGNVFVRNGKFEALIDTERSMWGDPAGDFIALDQLHPVESNKAFFQGYNQEGEPFLFTGETRARIALMQLYIGLIQFTEPDVRYWKWGPVYRGKKLFARSVLKKAVGSLSQLL